MQIKEPSEQVLTFITVSKIRRPQVIDRIDIEEADIKELAQNIHEQGLLQAPVLRPDGDEFEIVAGDRRILAVKLLEWTKVQCVVKEMSDAQAQWNCMLPEAGACLPSDCRAEGCGGGHYLVSCPDRWRCLRDAADE